MNRDLERALTIVVTKDVDIFLIKYTSSFEMYNRQIKQTGFAYAHRLLNEEEYEQLKEIVLCRQ